VPDEAEKVRWLFQVYLELGSMGRPLEEMSQQGIRTKVLILANGKSRGGVPYGKGALAYLLKNGCHVGEILHKGQIHPGEHEVIIERATFDAVQASLASNIVVRTIRATSAPCSNWRSYRLVWSRLSSPAPCQLG